MANTTIAVPLQYTQTVQAATSALLDAAVLAQVKVLNNSLVRPGNSGNAPGAVQNGSITVSESHISVNNETPTWYTTIMWIQYAIPV